MISKIDTIIKGKDFYNEMSRFIPSNILERTLYKEKFKPFLSAELQSLLGDLKTKLETK